MLKNAEPVGMVETNDNNIRRYIAFRKIIKR